MSSNKQVVGKYLATVDRSKIAPLLADQVEWIEWGDGVPETGAVTRGKAAFVANFGNDQLHSEVVRLTEENNVVVAEGTVRIPRKAGEELRFRFCDIFELENGRITRLSSFAVRLKDST